jgi:rfaE bifunctional protein kinase chain/domain
MVQFDRERLSELFATFKKQTIAVIGDLMLDRYVWGRVSRISPEAPVPVVEIESESFRFGGAANVSHNVMMLGARVLPVGVIGNDLSGDTLKNLFVEKGFEADGIVVDNDRPTTVKTRIIAHNQHVVRTDREVTHGISRKIQKQILDFLSRRIKTINGFIIEDYNKGLLTPRFIEDVIQLAVSNDKMIFVDPKFDHFFDYEGVTLFKPNLKEVTDKLGFRLDSDEAMERAGRKLLERIQCRALLITLGERGMILFETDKPGVQIPTRAVKVHDVSGAGDTVIASMAVAMTSGSGVLEAATIANHAAGIVCGEVGIVPVDRDRLFQELLDG